ncbi:MAG: transposase [Gammaproteobacteria bacterium]|nr:transposase [Gammaproteobacteria bacterium]
MRWLGTRFTPVFVGEAECNGVAECAIQTLKREYIHPHDFEILEEARAVIAALIERYTNGWLLQ